MSVRRERAGPECLLREAQARDELERQLLCPICLDMFSKPVVILPCQHNLCRKCANDVFQARGGPSVGGGGRFRCPSCRHEVVLDRHGVYGLQRNLLVENIIDIYTQQGARAAAAGGPGVRKDPEPRCAEHEDERVNIYCRSCSTPTCSLCKVFGSHQHCQVAPLSDVYEQHKAELSDGLAQVVGSSERLQDGLVALEGTLLLLEESSREQQRSIGEAFDALSAVLEARRRALTAAVQAQQDERARALRGHAAALAQRVDDAAKLVQATLQLLEEPGAAKFLQSAKSLQVRMAEVAAAAATVSALPAGSGVADLGRFRVDVSREADLLRRLDFVPDEVMEEMQEAVGAGTLSETATAAAVQGEASGGPKSPEGPPKTPGPDEQPPRPGTNPDPGPNPNAAETTAPGGAVEPGGDAELRSTTSASPEAGPRQDPPDPPATPEAAAGSTGAGTGRSATRGGLPSPSLWGVGGGLPRGSVFTREERSGAAAATGGAAIANTASSGSLRGERGGGAKAILNGGGGVCTAPGTATGAATGSGSSEDDPETSDGSSTYVFSFAWLNSQHK